MPSLASTQSQQKRPLVRLAGWPLFVGGRQARQTHGRGPQAAKRLLLELTDHWPAMFHLTYPTARFRLIPLEISHGQARPFRSPVL
jgi:hypothetical protein